METCNWENLAVVNGSSSPLDSTSSPAPTISTGPLRASKSSKSNSHVISSNCGMCCAECLLYETWSFGERVSGYKKCKGFKFNLQPHARVSQPVKPVKLFFFFFFLALAQNSMFSGLDPKCKIGQINNKLSRKKQKLYSDIELGDKLYHVIKC